MFCLVSFCFVELSVQPDILYTNNQYLYTDTIKSYVYSTFLVDTLFVWFLFLFDFSFCLNQNNFRYVDTHWIPLRVSTTNNQTGQIISNVTGVFGGWIFIDRFPMPPAHGRLTNVRQSFVFDLLSINIISSTLICSQSQSQLSH